MREKVVGSRGVLRFRLLCGKHTWGGAAGVEAEIAPGEYPGAGPGDRVMANLGC